MSSEKNLEELGKFEELTPEQIAERYPHLSIDDVSFLTQGKSFEVDSSKFGIGMRKYEYLQQKLQNARNFEFSNPTASKNPFALTELEKKQMAEFESKRPGVGVEPSEKMKEYARFIRSGETKDSFTNVGIPATKKIVYTAFKSFFELTTEKKFEENADNVANVGAVINYFLQDENFFQSPCLVENLDGKILKPSFNKGLLIIGCYGNGKTTILQVLSMVFDYFNNRSYNELWDTHKDWRKLTFKFKSCHELVTEFEGISEHDEKLAFFTKYSNSRYAFDDLTKESVSSNYGKKELMREVFEKRYDKRIEVLKKDAKYKTDYACKNIKTIVTMNFPDHAPNNVESALDLLGERYGGHIYDRAKEMFNILVFKGKSMRN